MVKGTSKTSGIASTLGARIRMVRKAWGWSQEDLARAIGSDQQIISYWERDKAKPTRSALQLLANTLHLSIKALSTGDGFTIPELPHPNASLDALRRSIETTMAIVGTGGIQGIDLSRDSIAALPIRDVRAFVDRAKKDGLTVWVIATAVPVAPD